MSILCVYYKQKGGEDLGVQNIKRPEVLSVRVRGGTKDQLKRVADLYSVKFRTELSQGQVLEMLLAKAEEDLLGE